MDVEIDQTVDIILKKKEAADRQELIEKDLKNITQEFYCERLKITILHPEGFVLICCWTDWVQPQIFDLVVYDT